MKDKNEVIDEFNELINMTASDLEAWLKSDDSRSAGWPKEDGAGESVGHDSGRKIVEILKSNPDKEPEKYTDDQVQHMRKVVSYCKRHLAQEEKIDNEKSVEELKKTKSYASLKNWGHDILKKRGKTEEDDGEEETEEKQTGEKRKATGGQSGKNKKRETRKGESNGAADDDEGDEDEEDEDLEEVDEEGDEEEDDQQDEKTQSKSSNGRKTRSQDTKNNGNNKQAKSKDEDKNEEEDNGEEEEGNDDKGSNGVKGPKKGDTVSWNWGGGQPEGKVLDVKPEETTITTKKGNQVSRKGDEEDPAVVLDAGSSKAIKLNHELN